MSDKNDTFILAVPVANYGDLATAAALHDIDISKWLSNGIETLAKSTPKVAPTPKTAPSYRPTEGDLLSLTGYPETN